MVPEHLFLDLRGFATVQPTYGGYGPAGTVAVSNQDETQTLSFSAHPYLRQAFDDFGTAELGAVVSYASQNSLTNSLSSGQSVPIAPVGEQNFTSEQEYFSLTSGPAFGRTSASMMVSGNQSTGSGVMNNAYQNSAVMNLGYAITRSITALTSFGYDDIHYAGIPPYNFSGGEWSVGGRWIPNPDSSITVTYGSQQGVQSAQVNASYALTARTRIYARYSEGITTGLEQLLNSMNGSSLDTAGNPVAGGVPVQLSNSFYGVQNNLARVTDASVTVTTLRERDAISLTFSHQQSQQIAAASAASAGSQNSTGWYGTLAWQRSLWPDLNASAFVEWGTNQSHPGKHRPECQYAGVQPEPFLRGLADHQRLRAIQLEPANLYRLGQWLPDTAHRPDRHRRAQDILSIRPGIPPCTNATTTSPDRLFSSHRMPASSMAAAATAGRSHT